jgi:hypothetical protein
VAFSFLRLRAVAPLKRCARGRNAKELFRIFNVSIVEGFVGFTQRFAEDEMFCDACGGAVQAGQPYCSKCGKQIKGPVAYMPQRPGRVKAHLQLLGLLWLALSAFNLVAGVVLYVIANTLFAHTQQFLPPDMANAPVGFLRPLLSVIAILVVVKAGVGFVAGWGLLQRESWSRIVVLVLAFISLFHIPFGTAIGVYTMWVLLPGESQEEYDAMAPAHAA